MSDNFTRIWSILMMNLTKGSIVRIHFLVQKKSRRSKLISNARNQRNHLKSRNNEISLLFLGGIYATVFWWHFYKGRKQTSVLLSISSALLDTSSYFLVLLYFRSTEVLLSSLPFLTMDSITRLNTKRNSASKGVLLQIFSCSWNTKIDLYINLKDFEKVNNFQFLDE